MLALAIATLITIFLIVRPPRSNAGDDTVRTLPSPTAAVSATATPTPTRPAATRTPATASPATSPSPGANRSYTIQPGDSLSSIAAANGTTVEAITALNPGVTPASLQPGATLLLPPAP